MQQVLPGTFDPMQHNSHAVTRTTMRITAPTMDLRRSTSAYASILL